MWNPPPQNWRCPAKQCGGGFPAYAKRPAPNRAGRLRVRLSERYNALDLAPRWGCKVVRPGNPRHPGLGFRPCLEAGVRRCFCRPAGGHNPAHGAGRETKDEGAGRKMSIKIASAISCGRCDWEIIGSCSVAWSSLSRQLWLHQILHCTAE